MCPSLERADGALPELFFVGVFPWIGVGHTVPEHGVDDAGQLMGGGADGARRSKLGTFAAEEGTERGAGVA